MTKKLVAFSSQRAFSRAVNAIRSAETMRQSEAPQQSGGASNGSASTVLVQITGPAVDFFYYPGKFVFRKPAHEGISTAYYGDDLATCTVTPLNENDILTEELYYFGTVHAEVTVDGSPLVVVTVGASEVRRPRLVEITNPQFDAINGYAWKELILDFAAAEFVDTDPIVEGNNLFEVNDNQTLTEGARLIMWQVSTNNPGVTENTYACQVQEEFPARITYPWDIVNGYRWVELKTVFPASPSSYFGGLITGSKGLELSGRQDIQVGSIVWLSRNGTGATSGWIFDRPLLNIDCGLAHDAATDIYYIDPEGFIDPTGAGGLMVDYSGDCPELYVVSPDTLTYSCGIERTDDDVHLNLTDVVFDGLYWDQDLCALGVDFGCGLELSGAQLVVKGTDVAGTAAVTALVPVSPCAVGVDLTVVSSEFETLVNDVSITVVGGTICLTKTKTVYSNKFNAAGLLIDRLVSSGPTETTTCVSMNICDLIVCCESTTPLTADCGIVGTGPTSGEAPLTIDFSSTPAGGTPPYIYFWDFGDGETSTEQNPSHTFEINGLFVPCVDITDSCGQTVTCCTDSVTIQPDPPECCEITTETYVVGGATCETATVLTGGEYWTDDITAGGWFRVDVPFGEFWYIARSQPCGGSTGPNIWYSPTPDCSGKLLFSSSDWECVSINGAFIDSAITIWADMGTADVEDCLKIVVGETGCPCGDVWPPNCP